MTEKSIITVERFTEATKELAKYDCVPALIIGINLDAVNGQDTFLFTCAPQMNLNFTTQLLEKILLQIKNK